MSEVQVPPPDTHPEKLLGVPNPPPPPNPLPSKETLEAWLPLYLNKTDHVISRLSKILSMPAGTDTLLMTICYSSRLISALLTSVSLHRLRNTARKIIEKAITLPPNTTVIIDTSTILSSRLLITANRLKALADLIADFRIFARLWGLLSIYRWGKSVVLSPSPDPLLRNIAYAQVAVNILYQYLENGAYLSSKGVLGWSTERQNRAWVWSSRFWMAHVGLDFVRLWRERERRRKGEGEREWREKWRREMVVNMAYAPLTLHWSLEKGIIGEAWIGLLGSIAAVNGLRVLWKDARPNS